MKFLYKKYLWIGGVGAIFLAIITIFIFSKVSAGSNNPQIISIDPQYAADFSDDRILMGASHDVFIGKVLRQSGTQNRGLLPQTQFEIQIISNIKGNLQGVITLNQVGGYQNGRLYIISDDIPGISPQDGPNYLLQPGDTYLLATRYNPTENWYTLNSFPTASKLISTNSSLSTVQLKALAAADPRVQQLTAAYPHEILMAADIAHNNTLNSYVSTHPLQPFVPAPATSTRSMLVSTSSIGTSSHP